ncbi:MAG: phosphotransferase [Saprospiraceae bacterium]|nr:phosphotransferase [Saprospiraceae bacterium]
MNKQAVLDILERQAFPGEGKGARLVETHISWVLLAPDFAFKIKKPVHFDFLDFSTLPLRKKYCHEELRLNQRLAPQTYLGVLPIGYQEGQLRIAEGIENPVDYAVWMRREDDRRQLDLLLKTADVLPDDLRPLAHQIAVFHRKHALAQPHFKAVELVGDFADLFHHETALAAALGNDALPMLAKMREDLPIFIEKHEKRLQERATSGLWVDGHGDLHGRNIFLTEPPIVFDCVEFAPHLRRLDVLNELAFLCMDFDHHARPDLAAAFLRFYQQEHACITQPEDELLFQFFKAYRANVRLKVALLGGAAKEEMQAYWDLMWRYWTLLFD